VKASRVNGRSGLLPGTTPREKLREAAGSDRGCRRCQSPVITPDVAVSVIGLIGARYWKVPSDFRFVGRGTVPLAVLVCAAPGFFVVDTGLPCIAFSLRHLERRRVVENRRRPALALHRPRETSAGSERCNLVWKQEQIWQQSLGCDPAHGQETFLSLSSVTPETRMREEPQPSGDRPQEVVACRPSGNSRRAAAECVR
jgi:hypothetical protein